jgi:chromosome segregation ATPase
VRDSRLAAAECAVPLQTMTDTLVQECDSLRATLHEWRVGSQSLEAQLSESMAALAAYQSHLDAWQQQLAHERERLRQEQEQLAHERTAARESNTGHEHASAEAGTEVAEAREKISALSASLLTRTEELRQMDERRSQLASELEMNQVREKELVAALEEQRRTLEVERSHRAEELRNLEKLQLSAEGAGPGQATSDNALAALEQSGRPAAEAGQQINENPVLGSIVEQFGKLRKQRAMDRQVLRKAR